MQIENVRPLPAVNTYAVRVDGPGAPHILRAFARLLEDFGPRCRVVGMTVNDMQDLGTITVEER